jgi:class 3 adenylate cyclase
MDHLTDVEYVGMAIGAFVVGLGIVVILAQQPTRTNISIGLVYVSYGLTTIWAMPLLDQVDADDPSLSARGFAIPAGVFLAASASYMTGLLQTSQAAPHRVRPVRAVVTFCYLLSGATAVLIFLFPAEILNDLLFSVWDLENLETAGFVFAPFFLVVGGASVYAWISISRLELDVGEQVRAICAAAISLLIAVTCVLPLRASLVVNVLAILLGLYGQFRYFVMQGERGAFLGRFLSTQVAELVRNDGLAAVMEPGERDVTVVACDLRGFTSYAEAVPSQAVIDLLNEYYEAVGVAVAEVAGTVKDYAGDGVLVIIGAPVARDDHAAAGLALARRLHEVVTPVRKHWGTGPHPLGMGLGVASGRVAVGAVGSSSRLEYTAVGTAVNLASRLCSAAGEGETLVDQSTVDVTGVDGLSTRGSMPIKGLSADHHVYALDAQPGSR